MALDNHNGSAWVISTFLIPNNSHFKINKINKINKTPRTSSRPRGPSPGVSVLTVRSPQVGVRSLRTSSLDESLPGVEALHRKCDNVGVA